MKTFLLWALALVLMLAAATYQRRTGPSYPVSGELQTPAGARPYELSRSHVTTSGAPVRIPAAVPAGTLLWRRYPLDEPFRQIPLTRIGDELAAVLPPQPPAGKVEYYLELPGAATSRLPADRTVVLRYRGEVPLVALIPHIIFMFLSMLIAVRAALGAATGRDEGRLAWVALTGFTIGGLILGPIVQKYAFGAYWTGWQFGPDLTDDKTAFMWLAWLIACLLPRWRPRWRRALIVTAAVVTVAVYLIPHSAQGSELDYTRQEATTPGQ
ncbi:MAG: hypothetical protein FIB01_00970 [Gemmatimonadetes bacterium]|nr:hypothetical protein [Gemmatimonadota bacterium]